MGYVEKIKKGWGHEIIFANEKEYCGKLLCFPKAGAKFSLHFHAIKKETWYVLSGSFTLVTINTQNASKNNYVLMTGDSWTNYPNEIHQLIAKEDGSLIVEVSTMDIKHDNYRVLPGDSQK